MELHPEHERDAQQGGPGGGHGQALGHRGLRRDEEPEHGGDVQPGDRHLVLRRQHGVARGRGRCGGHPHGLSDIIKSVIIDLVKVV